MYFTSAASNIDLDSELVHCVQQKFGKDACLNQAVNASLEAQGTAYTWLTNFHHVVFTTLWTADDLADAGQPCDRVRISFYISPSNAGTQEQHGGVYK